MISYKRDIIDEAQRVMNANMSLDNKNLISGLANEIVALRCEVERLEKYEEYMKRVAQIPPAVKLSLNWVQP